MMPGNLAQGPWMTQQSDERPRPAQRNPENDEFPTGPAVGGVLPDFALPDQHGQLVAFHASRKDDRAYLAFIRATSW